MILASLLAGPAPSPRTEPAAITEIRQEANARSTRLVVACTGPVAYTYYSPDPLTLVVDIPEVDPSKVPARINVGTREVESVRVTSMARADGRSLARLEVRLASLVPYQIFSKDTTLNLVFERGGRSRRERQRRAPGGGRARAGARVAAPRPPEPPDAADGESPRPPGAAESAVEHHASQAAARDATAGVERPLRAPTGARPRASSP